MIVIPEQLRNQEFRFIKIRGHTKFPLEKWSNPKRQYCFDDVELLEHLNKEDNYALLTGNNMVVIDIDDKKGYKIIEKLPKTFSVKTRRGHHFYYFCNLLKKQVIKKNDKHIGEIQAKGQYVIGPNSFHSKGDRYVPDETEIAKISVDDLKKALKHFFEVD